MKKLRRFLRVMGLGVYFSGILCINVFGQYQLSDPGFEQDWRSVSGKGGILGNTKVSGTEPVEWHSFVTAEASGLLRAAINGDQLKEETVDLRPGTTGKKCAKILAKNNSSVCANGNLTTGRVIAGNMCPRNNSNHNISKEGYQLSFTGRPDVLKVWVKYIPGVADTTTTKPVVQGVGCSDKNDYDVVRPYWNARVCAIIHGNGNYQDPGGTADDNLRVCDAIKNFSSVKNENGYAWQQLEVPFRYNVTTTNEPAYLLMTFTTNATPGCGNIADILLIDDIEFIYNSQLETLTYNGVPIAGFATDNYETLDMSSVSYDESELAYVSNGKGATVVSSYDDATGLLTLTVEGNDISVNPENCHIYKVQFKAPVDVTPIVGSYPSSLSVNVAGTLSPIISQDISLAVGNKSGTVNLSIKDFKFGGLPVGDINMIDIPVSLEEGKYVLENCTQNVFLSGLEAELPVELVAASVNAEKELAASLSIVVSPEMTVTVGVYPFTVVGTTDLKVTGHISAEASEVLLVDSEQTYTSVDLSEANIDAQVSYDKLMTNISNSKNLLIYVPASSSITGRNVVAGDKAANLVLTDKVSFNAPKTFTADAISYTRDCFIDGRWESIILPFSVEKVLSEGTSVSYSIEKNTKVDNNKIVFEKATVWAGNTPYIFSLGDATGSIGETKTCEFTGSGKIEITEASYESVVLKGGYTAKVFASANDAYLLNEEGTSFTACEINAKILPFGAYASDAMLTEPSYAVFHLDNGTGIKCCKKLGVDIDTVYTENGKVVVKVRQAQTIIVTDLVGRQVRTIDVKEGTTAIEGLAEGFYLINGHKVVVK